VYANGLENRSEKMEDYGSHLTARGEILHPGGVSEQTDISGPLEGNSLVRVDAKVVAVVYADHTAESSDEEALGRIQSHRSSVALALTKSGEILQRSLADSNESNPRARASGDIKKLLSSDPFAHGIEPVYLKGIIDELDRVPQAAAELGVSEREYLSQRLAKLRREAAKESRYAQIGRAQ
jgi:hypothetical protein